LVFSFPSAFWRRQSTCRYLWRAFPLRENTSPNDEATAGQFSEAMQIGTANVISGITNRTTHIVSPNQLYFVNEKANVKEPILSLQISRRDCFQATGATLGAAFTRVVALGYIKGSLNNVQSERSSKATLAPFNFTQIAKETRINITLECTTSPTCVSLDTVTFQKKRRA
jgi:hypothetical protein